MAESAILHLGVEPGGPPARFIVGMSRAGTTWLSKCLNEQPDAAVFGETAFWGRGFVEPGADGLYQQEHLDRVAAWLKQKTWIRQMTVPGAGSLKNITVDSMPLLVDEALAKVKPPAAPAAVFQALCGVVAKAEGKPCAVEKTPHHVNWMDRILAAMPDSRFVIMVREPYGFMLSYKHQGDRKVEPVRKAFADRYHPFGCAVVWRGYMRAAQAAKSRHAAQSLVVRFEDIQRDGRGELSRVQKFLGLEAADVVDRVPPDNTSFPGGKRPELSAPDLFWMNLMCGKLIDQYGVPRQRRSGGTGVIAWSMLTLPFWALRNALSMRKIIAGSPLRYFWRWLSPAAG